MNDINRRSIFLHENSHFGYFCKIDLEGPKDNNKEIEFKKSLVEWQMPQTVPMDKASRVCTKADKIRKMKTRQIFVLRSPWHGAKINLFFIVFAYPRIFMSLIRRKMSLESSYDKFIKVHVVCIILLPNFRPIPKPNIFTKLSVGVSNFPEKAECWLVGLVVLNLYFLGSILGAHKCSFL